LRQFGEDVRRRADLSREWIRERFHGESPITLASSLRPIYEQPPNPFRPLNPQNFDPSVVVVDKPGKEEEEEDRHPFSEFDLEFPMPMGFNGPKFWSFGSLFKNHRSWWNGYVIYF